MANRRRAEQGTVPKDQTARAEPQETSGVSSTLSFIMDERLNLVGQLLARKKLIIAVFLICAVPSAWLVLQLPKKYSAETVLLLDPRRNQLIEGLSAVTGLQVDAVAVNSEVNLLRLPGLAANVVQHLELTSRPEYMDAKQLDPNRPRTMLDRISELVDDVKSSLRSLASFFGGRDEPTDSVSDPDARKRRAEAIAVQRLSSSLEVLNDPRTYTIRVRYTSTDPVHSARVANAVVDLYIAQQREARAQAIREASTWLNQEIGALQERVTQSEEAVQQYRRQHGLGDDRTTSTAQQEVNALTLQVATAAGELAQAQAKLRQETGRIVYSLEEAVRVAATREANLREQLGNAKAKLDEVLAAEAGLRSLQREAAASRVLLEDLMRRARSADAQMDAPRPEARIVSRAMVPHAPSGPSLWRMIPAVFAGSAGAAIGVALLLSKLQGGFRSVAHAERYLGVNAVGETPKIRGGGWRARQLVVEHPTCRFAESIRSVCVSLLSERVDCPVILVTSPAPGDGKTIFSTALAQSLAISGRNCLLIDADLRRPAAHRLLNIRQQVGLGEVLAGSASLDDALVRVLPGPLTFLPAGEVVSDPIELLSARRLKPFIESVRRRFDVVIVDSPPILAVSDAHLLAGFVDQILMVLRWNVTTRSAAARAVTLLARRSNRSPLLVLSQVDHSRMSRYEEGRYGMDFSYQGRHWVSAQGVHGRGRLAVHEGDAQANGRPQTPRANENVG